MEVKIKIKISWFMLFLCSTSFICSTIKELISIFPLHNFQSYFDNIWTRYTTLITKNKYLKISLKKKNHCQLAILPCRPVMLIKMFLTPTNIPCWCVCVLLSLTPSTITLLVFVCVLSLALKNITLLACLCIYLN